MGPTVPHTTYGAHTYYHSIPLACDLLIQMPCLHTPQPGWLINVATFMNFIESWVSCTIRFEVIASSRVTPNILGRRCLSAGQAFKPILHELGFNYHEASRSSFKWPCRISCMHCRTSWSETIVSILGNHQGAWSCLSLSKVVITSQAARTRERVPESLAHVDGDYQLKLVVRHVKTRNDGEQEVKWTRPWRKTQGARMSRRLYLKGSLTQLWDCLFAQSTPCLCQAMCNALWIDQPQGPPESLSGCITTLCNRANSTGL